MMHITLDQLEIMREWASELDRLALSEQQIGSPAAYHLKQMDRALPELALQIRAMVVTIMGQDKRETRQ